MARIDGLDVEIEECVLLGQDGEVRVRKLNVAAAAPEVKYQRDQRRTAGIAANLQLPDERTEREALLIVSIEQRLLNRVQMLGEGRIARTAVAHGEHAHAMADQHPVASIAGNVQLRRGWDADDHVLLARQSVHPGV